MIKMCGNLKFYDIKTMKKNVLEVEGELMEVESAFKCDFQSCKS